MQTAGSNVKYHLNRMAADLFTVKNVTKIIDRNDFSRGCGVKYSVIFPLVKTGGNNFSFFTCICIHLVSFSLVEESKKGT